MGLCFGPPSDFLNLPSHLVDSFLPMLHLLSGPKPGISLTALLGSPLLSHLWVCSIKIPPRKTVQGTLGSLEEFSSPPSPHILVGPLVADTPDWKGAEQGQHSDRWRKEAGVGASTPEGNFSQLPSLLLSTFQIQSNIGLVKVPEFPLFKNGWF